MNLLDRNLMSLEAEHSEKSGISSYVNNGIELRSSAYDLTQSSRFANIDYIATVNDGAHFETLDVHIPNSEALAGHILAEVDKQKNIIAIHSIKVKNNDIAKRATASLLASTHADITVVGMADQTTDFWTELALSPRDFNNNANINWDDYYEKQYQKIRSNTRRNLDTRRGNSDTQSLGGEGRSGIENSIRQGDNNTSSQAGARGNDSEIKRTSALTGSNVSSKWRETEPALNQSDADWINTFCENQESRYFQLAGSRSFNANHIALEAAKQFTRDGHKPQAIREKTGWFIGFDNQWRYEINDSAAKLNEEKLPKQANYSHICPLSHVLDHPLLYQAYPHLKDIYIHADINPNIDATAEFTPPQANGKTISSPFIKLQAKSLDGMLDQLLEQTQIIIQHSEHHATRISPEYLKLGYNNMIENRYRESTEKLVKDLIDHTLTDTERAFLTAELDNIELTLNNLKTTRLDPAFSNQSKQLYGAREAALVAASRTFSDSERLSRSPMPPRDSVILYNNEPLHILPDKEALTPKGDITFKAKESVIRLTQAADKSSFIHEGAHLFLEMESRSVKHSPVTPLQQKILTWLNAPTFADINENQHEKFAEAFEQYILIGNPPQRNLKSIFQTAKNFMSNVCHSIKGTPPLSKEAKEIFDELLLSTEPLSTPELRDLLKHEDRIASQLVLSDAYTTKESIVCAEIIGAYARAKSQTDPHLNSVDRVFDAMSLRVEIVDTLSIEGNHFDFDTFQVDNPIVSVTDDVNAQKEDDEFALSPRLSMS